MNFKKILIHLVLLAVISFILIIVSQIAAERFFGFESSVYRTKTEAPFKKYLNIEVSNIPLFIDTYTGEDIKINYINETELVIEETSYDVLIKQDPDFSFSLFSKDQLSYRMEVLLPDRIYNSVTVTTTSGEVTIGYLYAQELYVSSRSGNINIYDTGGNINIQTISADVNISFIEFNDFVKIETVSGDVSVLMPYNKEPKLTFLTQTGYFTSNFFRFTYNKHKGDNFSVAGENPIPFHVFTKSGNLEFMKRTVHDHE